MWELGTTYALLGTAGLCLPSLTSLYYQELGLSSPPFQPSSIIRHCFFRYSVNPNYPLPKVESPRYSYITHMFHHYDFSHFASNFYTIVSSAWFMDLGCWKTSLLIYGGSVAGAFAHMLEMGILRNPCWQIITPVQKGETKVHAFLEQRVKPILGEQNEYIVEYLHDRVTSFKDYLPKVDRTFMLAGASSAAFSLMGAELYFIGSELYQIWRLLRKKKKDKILIEQTEPVLAHGHSREHILANRISNLLVMCTVRIVTVAGQLLSVMDRRSNTFDLFSLLNSSNSQIGHSAHIGGFVFGLLTMAVLDSMKLLPR